MFERYTEKARRVIFFARYEASVLGATDIGTEHLLLGLLREDKKLIALFLPAGTEALRQKLTTAAGARPYVPNHVDLPLAAEAKQALAFAMEEAERLEHPHIGTEHLLLGLLRVEGSAAAVLLAECGLRLDAARTELRDHATPPVTQRLTPTETTSAHGAPPDRDERWLREVAEACVASGLFTQEELMSEAARVAALRRLRAEAEGLLRLLAAKGLLGAERLVALPFELRDEKKLAEFIARLRQQAGDSRDESLPA